MVKLLYVYKFSFIFVPLANKYQNIFDVLKFLKQMYDNKYI